MRFLFKLIFTVIVLAAVAAVAVPLLVPVDYLQDQIAQAVKQQTGRDLTVAGGTSFSLFPDIGVRLGQVSLSNPPKMARGVMLTMDALSVNLRLLPLLSQRIEIKQFVLDRPVFDLRVDRNGHRSWDFAQNTARTLAEAGDNSGTQVRTRRPTLAQAGGFAASSLQDLSLGDVRIIGGTVKFKDERSGATQQLDEVNLKIALPQLSEPLEAEGTLAWRQEHVKLEGTLASPQKLLAEEVSPIELEITSAHLVSHFKGEVQLGNILLAKGSLKSSSPSLRNLAAWFGNPVPSRGGFGKAEIASTVTATPDTVTFADLRFHVDGMTGKGNASVVLGGDKPHLRSTLSLDKIDLNVFMRPAPIDVRAAPRPKPMTGPESQATDPSETGSPSDQSLTDFIDQINDQDEGRAKKTAPLVRGWSQRAFDFTALKLFDADLDFTAGALLFERIKVGKSVIKAVLRAGQLNADLNELQLYGGNGRGRLTIYGERAVPAIGAAFNLKSVSALPIMSDALAFDWISGRADFTVAVSGAGRSQNEMMRSLQGNGSVQFRDGAIEGLNIPQMIRSVSLGQIQGVQRSARLKTDFSELTGTFTVKSGVIHNSDLRLVGPLLRMSGKGQVDLPREWIDFTLEPRLVASLEGQGGEKDLAGLVIPIKVSGPLSNPGIKPDIEGLLQNPEAAAKQIGDLVKGLKGNKKNLGNVLDNLLGRSGGGAQGGEGAPAADGGAGGQDAGQSPKKARPEDLLNQIFR